MSDEPVRGRFVTALIFIGELLFVIVSILVFGVFCGMFLAWGGGGSDAFWLGSLFGVTLAGSAIAQAVSERGWKNL